MQIKDKYFYLLQPIFHYGFLVFMINNTLFSKYFTRSYELFYGFTISLIILLALCTWIAFLQYKNGNKIVYVIPKNIASILLLIIESAYMYIAYRTLGFVMVLLVTLVLGVVSILEYKDIDKNDFKEENYEMAVNTFLRVSILSLILLTTSFLFFYFAFSSFGLPGGV